MRFVRDRSIGLAEAVGDALAECPAALRVHDTERRMWTEYPWGEVIEVGRRIGQRLEEELGGRVAPIGIVGETTARTVSAIYGVWAIGASVVVLPGPIRGADAAQWATSVFARLRSMDCPVVFCEARLRESLERGLPDGMRLHDLESTETWARPIRFAHRRTESDAPAVLQSTAGSTGEPKIAVVSRAAVLNHVRGFFERAGGEDHDVGCSWLPLYHDMGLMALVIAMVSGANLWLAPTASFVRAPFDWITWLSDSRATLVAAPNFAYELLTRYTRDGAAVDLSALEYVISGGESVDCDSLARFSYQMSRFGFDPRALAPAYGLAEATCAVTAPRRGIGLTTDEVELVNLDRAGGVQRIRYAVLGRPLPGMDVRIAPNERISLRSESRDIGEVEIRGHSMMNGYLGERPLAANSWYRTGDIGYLVDDRLVVCGRLKEMVKVAGRSIFPQQIESVSAKVPGIRQGAVAAAVGSRRLVIVAEYVGQARESTKKDIRARVASECGVVPAIIELVKPGSLPRTTSGKLRRLRVGEQYGDTR